MTPNGRRVCRADEAEQVRLALLSASLAIKESSSDAAVCQCTLVGRCPADLLLYAPRCQQPQHQHLRIEDIEGQVKLHVA